MGPSHLSISVFRQMAGRAGRLGYSDSGEAILHIKNNAFERQLAASLCVGSLPPLLSSLHLGSGGGVEKVLLDLICCRRLRYQKEVAKFMECTLFACQHGTDLVFQRTQDAVEYLRLHQFINIIEGEGDGRLVPTQKGCASSSSGISPLDVDDVLNALEQARRRFILKSGFHAVFLATPPNPRLRVQWIHYETIVAQLLRDQPEVESTLLYLGFKQEEVSTFRLKPPKCDASFPSIQFYRRLFAAIVLYNVVQENPITKVADLIASSRGDIQMLQKDASIQCGMTVVFARKLNWDHVASILDSLSRRLSFGVRDDLLPLVRMGTDVMPAFRARSFYASGLQTPLLITQAKEDDICRVLADCAPFEDKRALDVTKRSSKLTMESDSLVTLDARGEKNGREFARLAQKIVAAAKDLIEKELNIMLLQSS